MIKRTVETVLTWSGIILHAVYFFILLLMSLILQMMILKIYDYERITKTR